jgi:hypothetical protein
MMSVPVIRGGSELEVDAPKRLFDINVGASAGPIFDVTADGSRFIYAARTGADTALSITVIQNWPQLIPRQ